MLHQPDSQWDAQQKPQDGTGKLGASSSALKPYSKENGNALPQEPSFHGQWSLDKRRPRTVQHPHARPWSVSSCPGKHESPEGVNVFHRVWLTDSGQRGRWNRARKGEYYDQQDNDLLSKKPFDEKACRQSGNYKFWTHLIDGGLKSGGQDEKLDYYYRGPNTGTTHFYVGKYANVKHCQRILSTGFKDPQTEERRDLSRDKRAPFDNRVRDDMINTNHEADKYYSTASYDLFRPKNTWSCPQLGADFVGRGF